MIRLSVLYPAGGEVTFDHDYYRDTHIPLVKSVWKPSKVEIDRGIDGPYVAAVHAYFDSMEALQGAVTDPRGAELMADVPNYTNATPVLQISDVG